MTIRQSGTQPRALQDGRASAADLGIADILRLLSSGAGGAILMALGKKGPLRTKELTERVPGYAPRTIYRYAGKLAEIGVIEREEEPGVPSKVVHQLSHPHGTDLYTLVDTYASTSLGRLPSGEIDAHSWGSLALLADLWESGMLEELNFGPRTATELAQVEHGLSYHQVSRRASLFAIGGLIRELPGVGRRRCYTLTEKARRAMALIAGLGRWRRRHVVPEGGTGLSAAEAAIVLRAALPLLELPKHGGKTFRLEVLEAGEEPGGEGELVWASVEPGGSVTGLADPASYVDGRGRGTAGAWIDALLSGSHGELQTDGDRRLIEACLLGLYSALWKRGGFG
jgi:DNA-binding HxlR family transcriptional regulator